MADLRERIVAWLGDQGYPLEMSVARTFRASRFQVRQSEFYLDPVEGAHREIDLLATCQRDFDGRLLRIGLPIECKMASEKPWLVFTDDSIRLAGPARVVQRASSKLGTKFLDLLASRDPNACNTGLFALPNRPGYAVTEAFTTGKDRAYEALMSATSAANALAQEFLRSHITAVFFPVVVLRGRMFECYLERDGAVAVNEVASASLVWRNPVVRMPHTIVQLTTESGLPHLIDRAAATVDLLMSQPAILAEAVGRPHVKDDAR